MTAPGSRDASGGRARFALGLLPTPLVSAHRLGCELGLELAVKRDDLIGFAQAGTKTRALEFLIGDMLRIGCDNVVGCGGPSSNFCPALAAAARMSGITCHIVLYGAVPAQAHPNLATAQAWGATVHFTGDPDRETVEDAAGAFGAELERSGRAPYVVPRGGATPIGASGAAGGVAELAAPGGTPPARIVVAAGSGGTAAGLLAGVAALGWPTTVIAVAVSRAVDATRAVIMDLAARCAAHLGTPAPGEGGLEVIDAIGPGFGLSGGADQAAADLALRTEGLVLDPTYTAKAMSTLVERAGDWPGGRTVFWHTGGLAGAVAAITSAPSNVGAPSRAGTTTGSR